MKNRGSRQECSAAKCGAKKSVYRAKKGTQKSLLNKQNSSDSKKSQIAIGTWRMSSVLGMVVETWWWMAFVIGGSHESVQVFGKFAVSSREKEWVWSGECGETHCLEIVWALEGNRWEWDEEKDILLSEIDAVSISGQLSCKMRGKCLSMCESKRFGVCKGEVHVETFLL